MGCLNDSKILDYVNGELAEQERADAHKHLFACTICKSKCMQLSRLVSELKPSASELQTHLEPTDIVNYLNKSLSQTEIEALEAHLARCNDCTMLLSTDEESEQAPFELRERIKNLVRPKSTTIMRRGGSTATMRILESRRSPVWGYAMAAAVLVGVIALIVVVSNMIPDSAPHKPIAKKDSGRPEPRQEDEAYVPGKPRDFRKEQFEQPQPKQDVARQPEPEPQPKIQPKKDDFVPPQPKKDDIVRPQPKEQPKQQPQEEPPKKQHHVQGPKKDDTQVRQPKVETRDTWLAIRSGSVMVSRNGGEPTSASGFLSLSPSDILTMEPRVRARLASEQDYEVVLDQDARLSFVTTTEGTRIRLEQGRAFFDVKKKGMNFVVETQAANAVVTGTRFVVNVDGKLTSLLVVEGTVRFENAKGKVLVKANQTSRAELGYAPTQPQPALDSGVAVGWAEKTGRDPGQEPYIERFVGGSGRQLAIGVPHCGWEFTAQDLGVAVSKEMDSGLVLAWGYLNKKGPNKLWVNVDKPTEGDVDDKGNVGVARETRRARDVFEEYMRGAYESVGLRGGPMHLFVGFRNHYEKVGDEELKVIQVATYGISPQQISEMKALWAEFLKMNKLEDGYQLAFDVTDRTIKYKGQSIDFKFFDTAAKSSGCLNPRYVRHGMLFYVPRGMRAQVGVYTKAFVMLIEHVYKFGAPPEMKPPKGWK